MWGLILLRPFRRPRRPVTATLDPADYELLRRLVDDETRRAIASQVRYTTQPRDLQQTATLYAHLDTLRDKLRRMEASGCR